MAFLSFWAIGNYRACNQIWSAWSKQDVSDILFYGMLGVILGGRIALLKYIADHSDREATENMDDIIYADPVGERDNDITFVDPAKELEDA